MAKENIEDGKKVCRILDYHVFVRGGGPEFWDKGGGETKGERSARGLHESRPETYCPIVTEGKRQGKGLIMVRLSEGGGEEKGPTLKSCRAEITMIRKRTEVRMPRGTEERKEKEKRGSESAYC